jgi:hypothetical protein
MSEIGAVLAELWLLLCLSGCGSWQWLGGSGGVAVRLK